ncbi:hypothetical protein J2X54_002630 [Duganella sp. 3397]|uniref:hypothetical protein n=1 Tax=Duganella sp. 3397 TaxID=2817732 RepID=UPI00285B34E4|nr:hypothetical protein [Duganella sp. 3397]MDR7050149.1 hypothetical protein [Duganella sp. 3397]
MNPSSAYMKFFLKSLRLSVMATVLLSGAAQAEIRQMNYSAAQTPWKLENYRADAIAVWGTASPCGGGVLGFAPDASLGDKNRFYATVIAAKTTGVTMFVYYDYQAAAGACLIVSFGLL